MPSLRTSIAIPLALLIFFTLCFLTVVGIRFYNIPTQAEVEAKIHSILTNPDMCRESNPKTAHAIQSIGINGQAFTLAEKTNAMPKRIDYYIKNAEGKTIAELVYRVDGGCYNLYVHPFPAHQGSAPPASAASTDAGKLFQEH